jgi:PQQ-like domain
MRGSRLGRLVLLVVLAAGTQGCWLQAGFGPERRGHNDLEAGVTTANVASLVPRWTASVDGPANEAVIDGDRAFVVSFREVAALSLTTGAKRWSVDACCDPGTPALAAGHLQLTHGCELVTFDLETGSAQFRAVGPEPPPPGFPVSCSGANVLAVGSRVIMPWLFSVPPIVGSPACPRGVGFWIEGPGISAVDLGAAPQDWEHSEVLSGCGFPPSISPFGPLSSDGAFALFSDGHIVKAIALDCNQTNCPLAWTVDVGAPVVGPAVALAGGDLAVATSDGRVSVVDATSHLVEWTADVGAPIAQPLAATAAAIFATGSDGSVAALPAGGCGAATCTADWTAALASPASARPSIGGDVLYVGSTDGTVTALPAAGCGAPTCDALWTGSTPSGITGAPAILAGTLVVGSSDGTVTAFGLPPGLGS